MLVLHEDSTFCERILIHGKAFLAVTTKRIDEAVFMARTSVIMYVANKLPVMADAVRRNNQLSSFNVIREDGVKLTCMLPIPANSSGQSG